MLNLSPKIIILTNLEEDHLDYYRDINQIIETFQKYTEKLPKNGVLILNADDPNLLKLGPRCRTITYGIKDKADVMALNIKISKDNQKFELVLRSNFLNHHRLLKIKLNIPGPFNIYNALAVTTCALSLGVKPEIIQKVLENFHGIWRRFEVKELTINDKLLTIISDYAHHPTAVRETIKAAKEFYPNRRVIAVFQPHHRNRTKKLFNDFVRSFDQADLTIISEIYDVAGRENKKDANISSKQLVEAIINYQKSGTSMRAGISTQANRSTKKSVWYAANLIETKKQLLKIIRPDDIVLIMGAGDIYKLASNFKEGAAIAPW
ncbi:MAG: Mur ligase family protein [Patescibacteria group bacterium]